MSETHYQKGARFERAVKKHLEELGWIVWRTPGSKSPADLIAAPASTSWGKFFLIQCQVASPFSKKKIAALKSVANQCNAIPAIAYKEDHKIKVEEV